MNRFFFLIAAIAVSGLIACGDKPVDNAAQPVAVEAPAPETAPAPEPVAPAAEDTPSKKINVQAEPGRTVVITDLQVGAPRPVEAGQLKFQDPGSQLKFKPDANIKLRPLPNTVPTAPAAVPQPAPATATGTD